MATRGTKPKPVEAHRRDGTTPKGGRREPVVVGGREAPPMPKGLPKAAQDVWKVVVADLTDSKVLDRADWSVVEVFAVTVARYRQARDELAAWPGLLTEGQKGSAVVNPLATFERDTGKLVVSLAEQLGLSPTGRARLGLAVKKGGDTVGQSLDSPQVPPRRLRAVSD